MKITIAEGKPFDLVAIDWQPAPMGYSWISLSFEDTEEDRKRWESSPGGAPSEISRFVSHMIPDDCIVYASVAMNSEDIADMSQRLRKLGFPYEDSENLRRHKLLRRLFVSRDKNHGVIYASVDKDFIVFAFEKYVDWMISSWVLLTSERPLEDWPRLLDHVTGRGRHMVTWNILEKVYLFMTNRREHGFEILTRKLSYVELEGMARKAVKGLNWTLEVR